MRLDTHQHFWHYDPAQHVWMTDAMGVLRRDYLPADLEPPLGAAGFDGTIAVQAWQMVEETDWLLTSRRTRSSGGPTARPGRTPSREVPGTRDPEGADMNEPHPPRRVLRSVGALLAGFVLVVVLSLGTDVALRATGVFPPWGHPMADALFLLATAYRTLYAVAGSTVTARLVATAMPCAWAGGRLGLVRRAGRPSRP